MTAFARSQDLIDAFAVAFNAKDADALGALFTEGAEFVNIRGARMRRREGIVEGHARSFAGPLIGSRITLDSIDELRVTEDVAVLHCHCVREKPVGAPTQTAPAIASVIVFVTRRGPYGWLAVAAANVPESPLPPPS